MKSNKQSHKSFKTLWLQVDKENTDKHQLFFKEHSIRNQNPEHPRGKTLFVLNIPPYVTTEALKSLFGKCCGPICNVFFTTSKGFKTAYVVFEQESALERALEFPEDSIIILNDDHNVCLTGLAKWCQEYNNSICDEEEMKREIENYMNNYDERIANKLANEKAITEGNQDNDGWITVTGEKKRGQFALARKESAINKLQHKEQQKDKKKQLINFYTFQIRESKKQNLAELRKKFELDKKRLQDLKSKRTFKPF
ncbi:ribosomal RNA-processing protein 7 homolog A [Nomia melanderi]|uniref:ribosomal RNA-processing protein 7 homolog A n=1 Tax=Nomia melanderi TaxID=2448451 RepID=UPI0013045406|nr:ribosomal RNA-processing protein 7 homolog A [Nomia melanderi]XP_031843489.1 ribosomal RNA-processing protein 7 homolog A [Nomia melanderi]XP_031843498.1 ribosomal RNA-processing protein 7 homolog A [Nomia melanderi]XP_031843506.1 ribosomal RNA-processing protein 7 homolog A [Nomia melanderi]XP_031843515.1 ribosomal RNA-processing protein 7 homolog A [Nomia melanderi]